MLTAEHTHLSEILDGGLRSVFQPIVALDDRGVVGFEALARGPEGHPLERPDRLFGAARAAGREDELCWRCQATAVDAAHTDRWLFVNVEPATLATVAPPDVRAVLDGASARLRLVAELTERAITDAPATLLTAVRRLRAAGWLIALDDVGVDGRSLAMLPVLRPDVVKLDRSVVQDAATPHAARVAAAVNAYADAAGATILAEGIEDERHAEAAITLGATLGQGWRYGRPAPGLVDRGRPAQAELACPPRADDPQSSPFAAACAGKRVRRGARGILVQVSRNLERQAATVDGPSVVVAAFERASAFDAPTARRYAELAREAALVVVLARDMPLAPAPGVRGVQVADDDPLGDEWVVAALGPHFAGALVARRCGGEDFEFVLSYDREVVVDVVRATLGRVGLDHSRASDRIIAG